jgi:hypothetical protein
MVKLFLGHTKAAVVIPLKLSTTSSVSHAFNASSKNLLLIPISNCSPLIFTLYVSVALPSAVAQENTISCSPILHLIGVFNWSLIIKEILSIIEITSFVLTFTVVEKVEDIIFL